MSTGAHNSEADRLIEAAHALGPTIKAMRDEIERERRLPMRLVDALQKQGFFNLWLAKAFGGPELTPTDYVRVVEALCRHVGSVAWCVATIAAYSRFSGFLPEPAARRLFVDEGAAIAGHMAPMGKAEVVEGGYRVTGRWPYGSGITHCAWTLGGCVVHDADGPRRGRDGALETTILFFPTRDAEVIDTWDTGGLRGTGSHDYQVTDLFVPEAYASNGRQPRLAGTLYALPHFTAFCIVIAAVPLGIARTALDAARELSSSKFTRVSPTVLNQRPVVQGAFGRAEGMLRAARAFLFEACEDAWRTVDGGQELTLEQRAAVRLSCAQVAEAAKSVVQIAYDIGGGTSVYESCPLQRCFRDMYAAVQHLQVQGGNFETAGRVLLGLDAGTPIL